MGRTSAGELVEANGIQLCYEATGDRTDPPVVLVMGLGTQLVGWPDGFVRALADRGHWVVRFDNRDVGLSTHLHEAGTPDLAAISAGDRGQAPYDLDDMAADLVGLLDALGLERAHLVGASLGGMVAQQTAVLHPWRVASLTSVMSTTGDPAVSAPTERALSVLLRPPARTRDEYVDGLLLSARTVGSQTHPADAEVIRARAELSYDRAHDPAGRARQLAAVMASGDRTDGLAAITAPTLVIHGAEDPLIPPAAGAATAAAIPGAQLHVLDGMGHDLPAPLWPVIVELIAGNVARGR